MQKVVKKKKNWAQLGTGVSNPWTSPASFYYIMLFLENTGFTV